MPSVYKKILCNSCVDELKVAYANNKNAKIDYRFKIAEGRCEYCKKSFREGLGMYDTEGIPFKTDV